MLERLTQLRSMAGGRNFTLLLDTATTSLATMVLVVVAARVLDARQLDAFALGQLVIVTVTGIMRSALYSPAMAAQRTTGRARVPLTWVLWIGVPMTVLVSTGVSPFMGLKNEHWTHWVPVLIATMASALAQDGARTVLVSRGRERLALISDAVVLVALVGCFLLFSSHVHSAAGVLLVWGACGLPGLALALVFIAAHPAPTDLPPQSLRATWGLTKWASIDIGLASVATLLPYFVATAALDSNTTGIYRTLQTSLGPLNIVHTTVITAFGLDAWQMSSLAGLKALNRKVNRLTIALTAGGIAYSVVAVFAMVLVSNLHSPSLHRIAIIMIITATMGAANSGFNAAALALGYQRSGAILRAVIVAATIAVSLPWSARTWVPWHDPIGSSAIVSAGATFIGWAISYRLAYVHETRLLEFPAPRRAA